jgi:hypothetical protein
VDLVVLLEFPQYGPNPGVLNPVVRQAQWLTQTTEQDAWDRIARSVAAEFPGRAVYLTTAQLFTPDGRFVTWMKTPSGSWARARKLDNEHMCPYGAAALGSLIVTDLRPSLSLGPMVPGWQSGAWTQDPRYNSPPGACPNDQPPAGYRGVRLPQSH